MEAGENRAKTIYEQYLIFEGSGGEGGLLPV